MGCIAIGFWKDTRCDEKLQSCQSIAEEVEFELALPDPRNFVVVDWQKPSRHRIISYLRNGRRISEYLGFAYCRFLCGISDAKMGNADLTDGKYLWPEGLAHYVECHSICLPEFFVNDLAANEYVPEKGVGLARFGSSDFEPWLNWAKTNRPKRSGDEDPGTGRTGH